MSRSNIDWKRVRESCGGPIERPCDDAPPCMAHLCPSLYVRCELPPGRTRAGGHR